MYYDLFFTDYCWKGSNKQGGGIDNLLGETILCHMC